VLVCLFLVVSQGRFVSCVESICLLPCLFRIAFGEAALNVL